MNYNYAIMLVIVVGLASCTSVEKEAADTIYYGGDILTMAGDNPTYVQSLGVTKGKIVFAGKKSDALKKYDGSHVDLQGKTLLPGFIDAHGHAWLCGFQALSANLLPEPDGKVNDIPTLIEELKSWSTTNEKALGKVGWIVGFGYDDAQLKENIHPTADMLDEVSTEYPVLIVHQSGHFGAMNHKALEMAGYDATSENPPGGIIRRVPGSQEPDGVLEEMAFFKAVFLVFARLDEAANNKLAAAGVDAYARFGFTTLQEGRASKAITETWRQLGEEGALDLDIVSYPDIQGELPYLLEVGAQKEYSNGFRVGGVKISLDGSPQGKTAWLTEPYVVPPAGESNDYLGYAAFEKEEDVVALIDTAYKYNWQVLAHCNGDASGDQLIRAVRQAVDKYGLGDRRTVMIHAQTVREDQLDSMKVLGIIPSFFGMHTFYWGDWHRDETLGRERAYRISPAQSTLKRDMIFTQHHDAPVALPSSTMILHTAVNRTSRSGDVIGPDQRIDPYTALKSITTWAAYQYFEENRKGTLEPGKLADLVILDRNPLKVDPSTIMDIQVMETIKEGVSVYRSDDPSL